MAGGCVRCPTPAGRCRTSHRLLLTLRPYLALSSLRRPPSRGVAPGLGWQRVPERSRLRQAALLLLPAAGLRRAQVGV